MIQYTSKDKKHKAEMASFKSKLQMQVSNENFQMQATAAKYKCTVKIHDTERIRDV